MERVAGLRVVGSEPVTGGYTTADRSVALLADGRRVYVKRATDPFTAKWLRAEHHVYESLAGQPFMADLVAWEDDGERPVLVLEDLSEAHWPPPWHPGDVDAVCEALDAISASPPPSGLPPASDWYDVLDMWPAVADDPEPFLRLGVATRSWLQAALPTLVEAAHRCDLGGSSLQHYDIRSDNLCLRPDGSVVVIDWNMACVGAPHFDLVSLLPSLHAEGGPRPEEVVGDRHAEEAALLAGYYAWSAGRPVIPRAPRVRVIQLVQLKTSLPWACRLLDLPPPDGPNA